MYIVRHTQNNRAYKTENKNEWKLHFILFICIFIFISRGGGNFIIFSLPQTTCFIHLHTKRKEQTAENVNSTTKQKTHNNHQKARKIQAYIGFSFGFFFVCAFVAFVCDFVYFIIIL